MSKKIKLSIIIVNFNTYKFLDKCLRSVYESDLPMDAMEIIVVDNGSKDGSRMLLSQNHPGIKLITNKKNIGFSKANNIGIKQAIGDYILLLNPDTVIPKNTLREMVSYMNLNPKVGISSCRVELAGGKLDDACHRGFPTPWNAFCHFAGLATLFPKSKFFNGYHFGFQDMDKIHEIDSCAGAFMLIRREAGEKVGWLDEDYFWYGEDLDFCYRVKQSDWKIMFIPDVLITHYKGISGGIKEHSQHLTTANRETKLMATKARFEVMGIFIQKHYRDKYPSWLTRLVFIAIRFKEYLNLLKYK